MRDNSLLIARNRNIVKRYRQLIALKKYRTDYIMKLLEQEFFVRSKTIYGIIQSTPSEDKAA